MKKNAPATEKSYSVQPVQSHWLDEVNTFVWTNISSNNLTISDIACAIYTSERQFYRKIKKITGKTPNRYLQILRLQKAKELLEAGTYSTVKEVALAVGYSRSDYFSRLYETYFGQRPIQYFQS